MKSVNFDFSAKLSSGDYDESYEPNPKSLARAGSEKSLVELEYKKMSFFTFFRILLSTKKLTFHPKPRLVQNHRVTDYNELNKPNPKFLTHIRSEKSPVELGVPKN